MQRETTFITHDAYTLPKANSVSPIYASLAAHGDMGSEIVELDNSIRLIINQIPDTLKSCIVQDQENLCKVRANNFAKMHSHIENIREEGSKARDKLLSDPEICKLNGEVSWYDERLEEIKAQISDHKHRISSLQTTVDGWPSEKTNLEDVIMVSKRQNSLLRCKKEVSENNTVIDKIESPRRDERNRGTPVEKFNRLREVDNEIRAVEREIRRLKLAEDVLGPIQMKRLLNRISLLRDNPPKIVELCVKYSRQANACIS